jgi:hypothetical protein
MAGLSLQALIDSARMFGRVDPSAFARIVLRSDERLATLAGVPVHAVKNDTSAPAIQGFVLGAIAVLEEALIINPDESRVLYWFNQERLGTFAMKTPAEIVASGDADSLIQYVESLDAGFVG